MANINVKVGIYGDIGCENEVIAQTVLRWHDLLCRIPNGYPCLGVYITDVATDDSVALVCNLTDLFAKHSEVQSLVLPTHKFTNEAWIALANALPSWKNIEALVLGRNEKPTKQDEINSICRTLPNTNVKDFCSYQYLFDAASLAEAIQTNLTRLAVSGSLIQQLLPMLTRSSELTELYLVGKLGNISDHSLDDLYSQDMIDIDGDDDRLSWFRARNGVCNVLAAGGLIRASIPRNLKPYDIRPFVEQMMKHSEHMRAMKLVVLGNGRVGKTTLLHVMHQMLDTNFKQDPTTIHSTVGVDSTSFDLGKAHITVQDFAGQLEYTATHSFFLSTEMVSIMVCFNLALSVDDQIQQVAYWLEFLNSGLPVPPLATNPKWNIILVGVQADQQHDFHLINNQNSIIKAWKRKWQNLPLVHQIFAVSALKSPESVQQLLSFVEVECNHIVDAHSALIPSSYQQFLANIRDLTNTSTFYHWKWLFEQVGARLLLEERAFQAMLRYFHIVGQIVWLPSGIVFMDPSVASKIVAKFVSPKHVRLSLLKIETKNVQIIESTEIGCLLDIDTADNKRLNNELELLCHLRVCFKLQVAGSKTSYHLFPSLSASIAKFQFSHTQNDKLLSGIQFVAPPGTIFVQGFICQVLVALFSTLNIYKADICLAGENGAVVRCPGLFAGEMIVMSSADHRTLVIVMNASDPDTSYAEEVFNQLILRDYSQYSTSDRQILCSTCLKACFCNLQIEPAEIGIIQDRGDVCTTFFHMPAIQMDLYQNKNCHTHEQDCHDIFISYRVFSEGAKSAGSYMERSGGVVEQLYRSLAICRTQQGNPIHVFWDQKCLDYWNDWELQVRRGLACSRAIVLLMSNKGMKGIMEKAGGLQDNLLVEYEAALLLNKRFGVAVLPVFLADIDSEGKGERRFTNFNFTAVFPNTPHNRRSGAHKFICQLSNDLPNEQTEFLGSIKDTMNELFKLAGVNMPNRWENEQETKRLVDHIVCLHEHALSVASHPARNLPASLPPPVSSTEDTVLISTQVSSSVQSVSSPLGTPMEHEPATAVVQEDPKQHSSNTTYDSVKPPRSSSFASGAVSPPPSSDRFASFLVLSSIALMIGVVVAWAYTRR